MIRGGDKVPGELLNVANLDLKIIITKEGKLL